MTTATEIANRALQLIGDRAILSYNDDNSRAEEIRRAYNVVRRSLLRSYKWNFAIRREVLAADVTAPAHGYSTQYSFPGECLRLLPQADDDWRIEGNKILTDDSGALNVVYIGDISDESQFDSYFAEAFAAHLAAACCQRITGSNALVAELNRYAKDTIADARQASAFEQNSEAFPTDSWLLARY